MQWCKILQTYVKYCNTLQLYYAILNTMVHGIANLLKVLQEYSMNGIIVAIRTSRTIIVRLAIVTIILRIAIIESITNWTHSLQYCALILCICYITYAIVQSIARGNAKLVKVVLTYPKFAILCNYIMHWKNRKYCKRTQSLQYFAIINV